MTHRDAKAQVVRKPDGEVEAQLVTYSAPLPPASEFEKYETVLPGAADRIIKLAENQSQHRRFIEKVVVIFDSLKAIGGLIAAFLIVLGGIFAAVYLIMNNKSPEGLTALIGPLVAAVAVFIWEKKSKQESGQK